MSLIIANKSISYWPNCPADILLVIFRKLNIKSLINAMFVNKYWQGVVEYYCEHFNITWEMLVEEGLKNKGLDFREKSRLNFKDTLISAQQWLDVKNADIYLHRNCAFDVIKDICIFKGNLIITTCEAVKHYDIETFKLIKTSNISCLEYVETSSLSVELNLSHVDSVVGYNQLSLLNKLHYNVCLCCKEKKKIFYDISLFKVYSNCCYIIDIKNILWLYQAEKCKWDIKMMAKYYGNKDFICGLHVHQEGVYVLLKRGEILRVDVDRRKFEKVFQLDVPMHYLDTKPYMFDTFSSLLRVSSNKNLQLYPQKGTDQIVVTCPGVTSVVEHGHVLLLGYEDGKVEIFLTDNLLNHSMTPERRFNLQSYSETAPHSIVAMDIYEESDCHHIFIATDRNVYQFLIREL